MIYLTLFKLTASLSSDHIPVVCTVVEVSVLLTSCVDVKVGGFVSHIARRIQTWSPGMDFAGVAHIPRHIHSVGALVNVLTCKQHFHLKRKKARQS